MDQKDHMIDQKGLKMYENRQKIEFSDQKNCFLAKFFPGTALKMNQLGLNIFELTFG